MKIHIQNLFVALAMLVASFNSQLSTARAQDFWVWTPQTNGIPNNGNQSWTSVASSADGTKLVACASIIAETGVGQIYTSTDSGTNTLAGGSSCFSDSHGRIIPSVFTASVHRESCKAIIK